MEPQGLVKPLNTHGPDQAQQRAVASVKRREKTPYKKEQKMRTEKRHVYLIQASDERMTKIGLATDPSARLKELQTGNPQTLILRYVFTSEQGESLERQLHHYFKDCRVQGEWFKLFADEIVDEVKSWKEIQQVVLVNDWVAPQYFPLQNSNKREVLVDGWDGTFAPEYSDSDLELLRQMEISHRLDEIEKRSFKVLIRNALCVLVLAALSTIQLFVDIGIHRDETFISRSVVLVVIIWVSTLIIWAILTYIYFNPDWYQQIEAHHQYWRRQRGSL